MPILQLCRSCGCRCRLLAIKVSRSLGVKVNAFVVQHQGERRHQLGFKPFGSLCDDLAERGRPSLYAFGMGDETRFIAPKNASPPLKLVRQALAPACSKNCPSWLKIGPCGPCNRQKLRPNLSAILKYSAECRLKWDSFFEKISLGCS